MHSNIYGLRLVDDKTPNQYKVVNEENLDYDMVSHFADYFRDYSKSQWWEELQWLHNCYEFIDITMKDGEYYITIKMEDLKFYLEDKLDNLKKFLEEMTYEKWLNDYLAQYEAQQKIEQTGGFHIITTTGVKEDESLWGASEYTLDDWLYTMYRYYNKTHTTLTFRVEGVLDYHH